MEKGLLHQQIFNLNSPVLENELQTFQQEVKERMEKYQVSQFVAMKKPLPNERMELCIIPCSDTSGNPQAQIAALKAEGFGELDTRSDAVLGKFKAMEFEQTVSFGTPGPKDGNGSPQKTD